VLAILGIGGCGPKPIYRTGSLDAPRTAREDTTTDAAGESRSETAHGGAAVEDAVPVPSGPIETALAAQADSWMGVPYRYGGTTRKGVDCSALAAALLDEVGVRLPRSVAEQRGVGHAIGAADVEAGDLVFFRLESKRVNHVGVALDDSRFVHASRSRGVTIDRLDDDYFGKRVAERRRVLEAPAHAPGDSIEVGTASAALGDSVPGGAVPDSTKEESAP
jgi:cell wall-associated NlpC family hydrolase